MTREELQRLYEDYIEAEATDLIGIRVIPAKRALVDGVRDFLAEPDPAVEIAYLKAALADVQSDVVELSRQIDAEAKHAALGPDEYCDVCTHREIEIMSDRLTAAEEELDKLRTETAPLPGPLTWKWDGGRCAVLDADRRIVGYLPPGRQSAAGASASELREAADEAESHDGGIEVAAWLRDRATAIEDGAGDE